MGLVMTAIIERPGKVALNRRKRARQLSGKPARMTEPGYAAIKTRGPK